MMSNLCAADPAAAGSALRKVQDGRVEARPSPSFPTSHARSLARRGTRRLDVVVQMPSSLPDAVTLSMTVQQVSS